MPQLVNATVQPKKKKKVILCERLICLGKRVISIFLGLTQSRIKLSPPIYKYQRVPNSIVKVTYLSWFLR